MKFRGVNLSKFFSDGPATNSIKRFYKQSTFVENPNKSHQLHKLANHLIHYLIKLDDKTMRTPYRHQLAVPNKVLAMLICTEFNRQQKYLKTGQMPILSLCRTAVDADIQGHLSEHLKTSIYQYLKTDSMLFIDWHFEALHEKFAQPLIDKFNSQMNAQIRVSDSLEPPHIKITQNFDKWVNGLNNWQLIGVQTMTIWLKSTIGAWSLANKLAPVQQIRKAATLEEIIQMQQNGQVQQKLMDRNQIELMVNCGALLYEMGCSDKN